MKFTETKLAGVYVIDIDRNEDERGFFARTWDAAEFRAHGLDGTLVQCSVSWNAKAGTIRGLHYQAAPHEEAKVVRCTMGAAFDVIVDLRTDSPTVQKWVSVDLSAENRRMVYIPKGCAHGFQTLEDGTEIFYEISEAQEAGSARGLRWDDSKIGITWPRAVSVMSAKDRGLPTL